MARSHHKCWLMAFALVGCQIVVSFTAAAARADETRTFDQLSHPTRLECTQMPLPDIMEYLADYHDIPISLDLAEIKKLGLNLGPSQVTKKTTGRLDDTLTEILGPFNLSFMIEGDKLLITSQPKSRPWQEKYATSPARTK